MAILYIGPDGNILPYDKTLPLDIMLYDQHRSGKPYKDHRRTHNGKKATEEPSIVFDPSCPFCARCNEWPIKNQQWTIHHVYHVAIPVMLIMEKRYPDEYERMRYANDINVRNVNIIHKGYAVGSLEDRMRDMVNLLDELLTVRDMSVRIYDEIIASGDMKYYGTAVQALKEVRMTVETMGKFSLIARRMEQEGERDKLPAPLLELVDRVSQMDREVVDEGISEEGVRKVIVPAKAGDDISGVREAGLIFSSGIHSRDRSG